MYCLSPKFTQMFNCQLSESVLKYQENIYKCQIVSNNKGSNRFLSAIADDFE